MRHRKQVALIFGAAIATVVAVGLSGGPGIMRAFSVGILALFVFLLARSFFGPHFEDEGAFFRQHVLLRRANRHLLAGVIAGALPAVADLENSMVQSVSILLTITFAAGTVLALVQVRRLQKSSTQ